MSPHSTSPRHLSAPLRGGNLFPLPILLLLLLLAFPHHSGSVPQGAGEGEEGGPQSQVYRTWAARPPVNCSCGREVGQLTKAVEEERQQRQALKSSLETYVSELYELRAMVKALNTSRNNRDPAPSKYSSKEVSGSGRRPPSISFSAKLSYNREMKPLDTVVFDTVLANNGEGYNVETGHFTAPLAGTYLFVATVLSGYNTKVETALIVDDKEVARIYSGAHDAHGSGSNAAILNLQAGDRVWVRLLYQGGNHVHGYYSTFSGAILTEGDQ
ncbi:hypothetical protein ACOMHN_044685 [Nucella lapillus]